MEAIKTASFVLVTVSSSSESEAAARFLGLLGKGQIRTVGEVLVAAQVLFSSDDPQGTGATLIAGLSEAKRTLVLFK